MGLFFITFLYFCSMKNPIIADIAGKKIIILGFGKEGRSTYSFIRKHLPEQPLTIADQSAAINTDLFSRDPSVELITGERYNENLNDWEVIFKSPGINLSRLNYLILSEKITSQTAFFLKYYGKQTVGITGTKGKSTTASIIWHILKMADRQTILAGNIGTPFFDTIDQLTPETIIVAELSAHQLEYTDSSPHIGILLNLYQEHLDHFISLNDYQTAKFNITYFQDNRDYLIYNFDDQRIVKDISSHGFSRHFLPFSINKRIDNGAYCTHSKIHLVKEKVIYEDYDLSDYQNLPGKHNYNNVMAAILTAKIFNVESFLILDALKSYKPLEHRIEYIANFQGIKFYNDSISTIPEATIAAVNALKKVQTLILGGFDRGIDYHLLIDFLAHSEVKNVIFTGPAGERILAEWKKSKKRLPDLFILENNFSNIVQFAFENTQQGKICLLSPAASSYDQFKNFEERGLTFKNEVISSGMHIK